MPVNQPQLLVTIGGATVAGAMSLQVESLAYFSADRFQIKFAIGAGGSSIGYFASLGMQIISIEVATISGYANLIAGQIDNIVIDLLKNTATVSGRDLSAQLIDTEISETFNNQTSSQIAGIIAARHGLGSNVTATSTPVGQYYELDHAHSALGLHSRITTEWNLLTQLAQLEGFILGVSNNILTFGPPSVTPPIFLTMQDIMSLEFDLATTIPTAATVKSWNSRSKATISQTAGQANGTTIIRPNLTAAQASAVAASHLAALAQHATVLTATMPGDVTMTPASQITLSGTNSTLDQTYSVDAVSRLLDAHRGFIQTIRAHAAQ